MSSYEDETGVKLIIIIIIILEDNLSRDFQYQIQILNIHM